MFYTRLGLLELTMETDTKADTPFVVLDSETIATRASWLLLATDAQAHLRCCDDRSIVGVVASDFMTDIALVKISPPYEGYLEIPHRETPALIGEPLSILYTLPIRIDGGMGYSSMNSSTLNMFHLDGLGRVEIIENDNPYAYIASLVVDTDSVPIGLVGAWGGADYDMLARFDKLLKLEQSDPISLPEYFPGNTAFDNPSASLSCAAAVMRHEGKFSEALEFVNQATKLDPTNWYAHYLSGVLADMQSGDLPRARAQLVESTRIEPDWPESWFSLGLVQFSSDDFTSAEASLRRAISLDPDHPDALHMLGVTMWELQGPESAIEYFAAASDADPTKYMFVQNLQAALKELDRESEALVYIRRVIALDPEQSEPRMDLAIHHLRAEEYTEANEQISTILKDEPDNVRAHIGAVMIQINLDNLKSADEHLRRVIELDPDHPTIGYLQREIAAARDG